MLSLEISTFYISRQFTVNRSFGLSASQSLPLKHVIDTQCQFLRVDFMQL